MPRLDSSWNNGEASMDADLTVLQERCRKDADSYREDYLAQQNHYLSLLAAASLQPSDAPTRLPDVASFIASTAALYGPEAASAVTTPTIALLAEAAGAMQPATRRALVRTLALLRSRGAADARDVIPLFFRLLECEDKVLRRMLHGHILADVKRMQARGDAGRRNLQAFLYGMVVEPNEVLVKRSLIVLIDLFRKRIWHDARTANVIGSCLFHDAPSVALISAKFLLDSESKAAGDESSDSDDEDQDQFADSASAKHAKKGRDGQKASDMWKAFNMTGKKSSKKKRAMERLINRTTRVRKTSGTSTRLENPHDPAFAAMMLLHDPQDFAERLYSDLQKKRRNEPYENRLILINLLTRLVGTHKLFVLNLYPFLQRYLQPAQPEVTRVLAYLAQGCHELVPPDTLHPVIRLLADSFVSEKSSPPSMAAGINTIRAICTRVPLAILDAENEDKPEAQQEAPLLEDLVQYKDNRDRGVSMAARSLISLYRDVHPRLLKKRDRGRSAAEAVQKGTTGPAPAYAKSRFATGVKGAELLDESDVDSVGTADERELSSSIHEMQYHGSSLPSDNALGTDDVREVENRRTCDEDTALENHVIVSSGNLIGLETKIDGVIRSQECVAAGDDVDSSQEDDIDSHSSGEDEDDICRPAEGICADDGDSLPDSENTQDDEEVERVGSGSVLEQSESGGRPRTDRTRILTDEDYARIRAREAARLVANSGKRTRSIAAVVDTGDAVDPAEIQGPVKRERRTLEERMESVLAGREGREKFGSRKGLKKGGGSTNKVKLKSKANSMMIHKNRRKSKLSRREVQQMKKKKKRGRK